MNQGNEQLPSLLGPGAPRLHVLSDNPAVSRRIVAALGTAEGPAVHAISRPDTLEEESVDALTIFIFACEVDEAAGMATLRRLRRAHREPPIVVVSPPANATSVRRALDAGADAFVFETEIEATLAATVLAVASGQSVVPRKLRESVEKPSFSHRERQVLALVAEGLTNSEIAERLLLSQSTIKSHLSSAFAKLGIRSRKEVTSLLLDPEQAQSVGLVGVAAGESAVTDSNGFEIRSSPSAPRSVA